MSENKCSKCGSLLLSTGFCSYMHCDNYMHINKAELNHSEYKSCKHETKLKRPELKWYSCDEKLPEECKRYAVRLTNDCYTTQLRTPSLKEAEDSCYAWLSLLVSHWSELPLAYFPWGDGEGEWTRYEEYEEETYPKFEGNKKEYFVTLMDGTVDVSLYWNELNNGTKGFASDFDNKRERRVIAWMPMKLLEEKEAD